MVALEDEAMAEAITRLIGVGAVLFVWSAWLIPGSAHRWARRLSAERKAARRYQ